MVVTPTLTDLGADGQASSLFPAAAHVLHAIPFMDYRTSPTDARDRQRPAAPRRLVRCQTCGRSEEVSSDDLQGYMQTGWPKCCGGVMTYFTEADRPEG
jgi:hypothetical protein